MYVTRRARRLAPPRMRILFGAAALIGAGAFCLAVIVAYGWGVTSAEPAQHSGQNLIFTGLVLLLIGFVLWLWRQLSAALEENRDGRRFF